MLLIKKNETNSLVVTVSEHKTLSSPYYLFSFTHIQSKEKERFMPLVNSGNQTRYDEFQVQDSTTLPEDLIANTPVINLAYTGQYYYSIYEMATQSLDPNAAISKLEEGRAVVIDTTEENYTHYTSDNEDAEQIIYIS